MILYLSCSAREVAIRLLARQFALCGILLGLVLSACNQAAAPGGAPGGSSAGRISAIAGFYPLQEALEQVGGDRVDVTNLVPAGAEPHDIELSPRELERLRQARLLVYVGAGFQPGLEKAVQALQAPGLTVVDVTQGISLLEGAEDEEDEPAGQATPPSVMSRRDPHVWLDPLLMKEIVGKVRDALTRIDPAGRDVFDVNSVRYQAQLDALNDELRVGLQHCARREIVTSHAAFQYLASRYGLEQVPISGISPEAEPSPQRLREVTRIAREHGARVIYFETLVDPRVAATIAREVGAQTMVLNPIEGLTPEEQRQGKRYPDIMRENLVNLRIGLDCS